ncbi:MAG: inorganic phosphate transporter [Myxococcales bacterium]|nr:inorganic phosphate transporter [Myxococcales bacterium]
MELGLIIGVGLTLAYANGSNDNIKGVATLIGSQTTGYRSALVWATLTTALGSVGAIFLAGALLKAFTGKGIVSAAAVAKRAFPLSVALAAGATVLLATWLGFPISTTHALLGALVGAGLSEGATVDGTRLLATFVVPLLVSPLLAIVLAALLYRLFRFLRLRWRVEQETAIYLDREIVAVVPGNPGREAALRAIALPTIASGTAVHETAVRYRGTLLGFNARKLLDTLHFLSAGLVSFARGLNDTPKIAAIFVAGGALGGEVSLLAVGLGIALGGWWSAKRVAETMAYRVTEMNAGQGFSANFVTSVLVIVASRLGLPVSTTHVSVGALFGIGAATRQARGSVIGQILLAWVITLPVAGLLGASIDSVLSRLL